MNQLRRQAQLQHRSTVRKAEQPARPDRYLAVVNPLGASIRPYGKRILTKHTPAAKRSIIKTFTVQSRRRLMRRLSYLHHKVVVFFTATYPGYPVACKVKRDIDVFTRRLLRQHPHIMIVWRVERQKRGSWHVHMLIYGMPYVPWHVLARDWVEVAGLPDYCVKTATHIRFVRGNSRQCLYYISKYIAKVDGNNDNDDDGNSDAGDSGGTGDADEYPGRYWGVVGRKNESLYWLSYTIIMTAQQFFTLRRVIRKLRGRNMFITFGQFVWGASSVMLRLAGVSPDAYYRERLACS